MQTGTRPLVSLIVPAFNEAPEIIRASLESVRNQSFGDFECILVDESTKSESAMACRQYCETDPRFRYVHPEQRLGLAASLNLGISMARGVFIARFDSDDICQSDRLALQVAYMNAHPDIGVLGGNIEIISEDGTNILAYRDYPSGHSAIERMMQSTTPISHPTVMLRKQLLDTYGAYDPSFKFSEDLDLWLRLLNHNVRFANLPEILVRYRQQTTRRQPAHWEYNLRARVRNFSSRYFVRRILGICAIGVWAQLPPLFQESAYGKIVLRKQKV